MILTMDKTTEFFSDYLRPFFAGIDTMLFSLISWIFEGIFNLADLTPKSELTRTILDRVYVILALFMIFKLTFSFLQYLINPELMSDKEKGFGKIVMRTVIMLCILVMLPTLFFEPIISYNSNEPSTTILSALQSGVLKTLPKLILGIDSRDDIKDSSKENGQYMALEILRAFYYPAVCNDDSEVYDAARCEDSLKIDSSQPYAQSGNNLVPEIGSVYALNPSILQPDPNNSGYYAYQYTWPLTTISAIAIAIILLGIAIDVAVRAFKLLFLQVIAPVPVMSYIDPKSSKDGAFASWTKLFVSTYIEIFIKIGTVYLLILLFSEAIAKKNLFEKMESQGSAGRFVKVFLIIGLFYFAKEAPKFIKDSLGIKDSGGGGLFGGLSKLGAAAGVVGGGLAGLAGGTLAGANAARAASSLAKGQGASGLKAFGSGLKAFGAGGLASSVRGMYQGGKGAAKGNALKGMGAAVAAQNALTQKKIANAAAGSTMLGRLGTRADRFFTGSTAADRAQEDLDVYKEKIDDVKNFKSVLADSASKSSTKLDVGSAKGVTLRDFKGTLAAANAGDQAAIQKLKDFGFKKTVTSTSTVMRGGKPVTVHTSAEVGDLAAANIGANDFEKAYQKAYYNAIDSGVIKDDPDAQAVISAQSVANARLSELKLTDKSGNSINSVTADNAGAIIGAATGEINKIKSDPKFKTNKANRDAVKKNS